MHCRQSWEPGRASAVQGAPVGEQAQEHSSAATRGAGRDPPRRRCKLRECGPKKGCAGGADTSAGRGRGSPSGPTGMSGAKGPEGRATTEGDEGGDGPGAAREGGATAADESVESHSAARTSSSSNAQSGSAPAPPSHCRDGSDEEGGDEMAGAAGTAAPEGADTARAEIR